MNASSLIAEVADLPACLSEEGGGEEAEVVDQVEAVPEGRRKEHGDDGETSRGPIVDALAQPPRCADVPVVQHHLRVRSQLPPEQKGKVTRF